jgi:hypothetical protein
MEEKATFRKAGFTASGASSERFAVCSLKLKDPEAGRLAVCPASHSIGM